MLSKSLFHYPRTTFVTGEKYLWNPVLKKAYKNLPEERIRLRMVEYLILEAGFSRNRITFESPVSLPRDKSSSRTDLICYDKDFRPLLLAEVKRQDVKLDEKVALQIGRYNQEVKAHYLMVTNGRVDYWFRHRAESLITLDETPEEFSSRDDVYRDFMYWVSRGFASQDTNQKAVDWITQTAQKLYHNPKHSPPIYINFDGTPPEMVLSNYYRIFDVDSAHRPAVALSASPKGSTLLNLILNRTNENVALLSVDLDKLMDLNPENTTLQSQAGTQFLNIRKEIDFNCERPLTHFIQAFTDVMLRD